MMMTMKIAMTMRKTNSVATIAIRESRDSGNR